MYLRRTSTWREWHEAPADRQRNTAEDARTRSGAWKKRRTSHSRLVEANAASPSRVRLDYEKSKIDGDIERRGLSMVEQGNRVEVSLPMSG